MFKLLKSLSTCTLLSQLQIWKSVVIYFLTVFKDNAFVLIIPRGLTVFPDHKIYGMKRSKIKDI